MVDLLFFPPGSPPSCDKLLHLRYLSRLLLRRKSLGRLRALAELAVARLFLVVVLFTPPSQGESVQNKCDISSGTGVTYTAAGAGGGNNMMMMMMMDDGEYR